MASRIGNVLQDQNLNVHFHDASSGWKTNVTKVPKKGGFGGRTPLGDLSNSVKPSASQTSKKQDLDARKKTTTSKASTKVGRKALSDISNSGVPNVNEASKKRQNTKLNAKAEERIHLSSIAEEQFLHNHQECIKAQTRPMDLDQFLQILGLDNDASKQLNLQAHATSAKEEDESCLMHFELEEMIEPAIEMSSRLDSSPACSSPVSPRTSFRWDEEDYVVDFKLIESPPRN